MVSLIAVTTKEEVSDSDNEVPTVQAEAGEEGFPEGSRRRMG